MRFQDSKVVITGAAGVYGRALATAFAAEGATLLLTDRDAAALAAAAPALPPARLALHAADLADDRALDALVAAANAGGAPHVLVNNAGLYPFRLMQGIGAAMAQAGRGSIVNVTSSAAEVIRGNGVPYGASKCALEYLTRAFAIELGAAGVRVNSARPGFAEGSALVTMPPGYAEAIRARSLLGRINTPAEFAEALLFLCSDAAANMTGAVFDLGGGGHINRRDGASTRARS